MKNIIYFLLLSLHFNAEAGSVKVLVRNNSMNLAPVELSDTHGMFNDDRNTFKYFNIVKGTDEGEKLIAHLDEKEQMRVATLGFHLTKARDYFVKVLKAEHLNKEDKLTVRYDMARGFNPGRHYTPTDSNYNNAVTLKGSNMYALPQVKKWGTEIWFRPAKNIETKAPKGSIQSGSITNDLLHLADTAVIDLTKNTSLGLGVERIDGTHYAAQVGLLLVLKKIVPTILDFTVSSIPYDTNLDSAMVPEIIYHEFAHVAMNDVIPLTGSFAVSEGLANYFAAVISGNTTIAGKLGEQGKNIQPIKVNSNTKYKSEYETLDEHSHNPFTYNYLWSMRDRVNKEISIPQENSAEVFDRIVFESRKYIDFSSNLSIAKSLPEALKTATGKVGLEASTARGIRLIISQTANNVGM